MFGLVLGTCLCIITAHSEILGVFEVSRHGARTPLEINTWDEINWSEGPGELTREGIMQHYLLGQEFYNRYIIGKNKFLNERFNLTEVYIRTTDYHRTIMSAQSQLAGFFPKGPSIASHMKYKAVPPFEINDVNKTINSLGLAALPNYYQPVPIDTETIDKDNLLLGYSRSCPKIREIMKDVQQSQEYRDKVSDYIANLQANLSVIIGRTVGFEEAGLVGDSLDCIQYHGYPFPEGVTDEIFQELLKIRVYANSYPFTGNGAYLASSVFYQETITVFNQLIEGKSTRKWNFYSSHDTSIIGFLSAINAWDGINPAFASTLVLELHKLEDKHFVKLLYNDKLLSIGGCALECPIDEYVKFINSWLITDVENACKVKYSAYRERLYNPFFEKQT